MTNVAEMKRPKSEAAGGDVAVGTVMEFRIGEGASSLQLSSCFGRDDGIEVWNDVLDKMRRAGFRQTALADIDAFTQGILVQRREMNEAQELYQRAERTHNEMMAASDARVDAFNAEASRIAVSDEEAFSGGDKRGAYKMSHSASQAIARIKSSIEHEVREQDKLMAEREGAMRNHESAMRSFTKKIEWFESERDRLNALISE